MNVAVLRQFLASLTAPIRASDPTSNAATELEQSCELLEHFDRYDLGQFVAFLRRAEGLHQRNEVGMPGPAETRATQLEELSQRLDSNLQRLETAGAEQVASIREHVDRQRESFANLVTQMSKQFGLAVKVTKDKKWFDSTLNDRKSQRSAKQLEDRLATISDPAELLDEGLQRELDTIVENLGLDGVKSLATHLGVKPTGRDPKKILNSVVEKVTGLKIPKPSKRKSTPTTDPGVVRKHAVRLHEYLEKSLDPDGLTDEQIRNHLDDLGHLDQTTLKAVAEEAGISKPGRSKSDILVTIRRRLTEAKRAVQELEV